MPKPIPGEQIYCRRAACRAALTEQNACLHTQTGERYCPRCARRINEVAGCQMVAFPARANVAESSMENFGVFLETGVTVDVPADLDPDKPEGYAEVKRLATAKFIALLQGGEFEIQVEH